MATKQMEQLKRFNEANQARVNATNKASDSGNVGQVGQPQKPTQAVRRNPTPRQTATPAQVAMHDRKRKAQRTAYEAATLKAAFKKRISQQKQQTVPKAPVGTPKKGKYLLRGPHLFKCRKRDQWILLQRNEQEL